MASPAGVGRPGVLPCSRAQGVYHHAGADDGIASRNSISSFPGARWRLTRRVDGFAGARGKVAGWAPSPLARGTGSKLVAQAEAEAASRRTGGRGEGDGEDVMEVDVDLFSVPSMTFHRPGQGWRGRGGTGSSGRPGGAGVSGNRDGTRNFGNRSGASFGNRGGASFGNRGGASFGNRGGGRGAAAQRSRAARRQRREEIDNPTRPLNRPGALLVPFEGMRLSELAEQLGCRSTREVTSILSSHGVLTGPASQLDREMVEMVARRMEVEVLVDDPQTPGATSRLPPKKSKQAELAAEKEVLETEQDASGGRAAPLRDPWQPLRGGPDGSVRGGGGARPPARSAWVNGARPPAELRDQRAPSRAQPGISGPGRNSSALRSASTEPAPVASSPRPPVVTVLGHVDHGKTTLLDRILKTRVAAGEAGGITQRIGAMECVLGDEASAGRGDAARKRAKGRKKKARAASSLAGVTAGGHEGEAHGITVDAVDGVEAPAGLTTSDAADTEATDVDSAVRAAGKDVSIADRPVGTSAPVAASTHSPGITKLTFLDTPGHAAFAAMRARGTRVTDVAVLVVAVDDGVAPQTREAIAHVRDAGVPLVVAINKCDLLGAAPDVVRSQLAAEGLVDEAWGGDTVVVEMSARTGKGVDDLLESLLLVAEMEELRAVAEGPASGAVLESGVDRQLGAVATLLVQEGELRVGDVLSAGPAHGRVRSMRSSSGTVNTAGPSRAVLVSGLHSAPEAGDTFAVHASEHEARKAAEAVAAEREETRLAEPTTYIKPTASTLHLVIRTAVTGSLDAIAAALQGLPQERVALRTLKASSGDVTISDVELARASSGCVIAFGTKKLRTEVRAAAAALPPVPVLEHDVVYHLVDAVRGAMAGALPDVVVREETGAANILALFGEPDPIIAGCRVVEGRIRNGDAIRVLRHGTKQILVSHITSLKVFKNEVSKVDAGSECGLMADEFSKWLPGDRVQAFKLAKHHGFLTAEEEAASGVDVIPEAEAHKLASLLHWNG